MKTIQKRAWFKAAGVGIASIFLLVTSGCGAMFGKSNQMVSLNSDPAQAKATIKGAKNGQDITVITPGSIQLTKKSAYIVRMEKEGYTPQEIQINRKLNGGTVAMDVIWCVLLAPWLFWVPLVIDGPTGAWYELTPSNVSAVLQPAGAPAPAPEQPPAATPGQM
jgi:hypothetical protein